MKQQTHLLIIGYVWPEPRSSAAGAHMLQLIEQFLSQQWAITFASPALATEHNTNLTNLGIAQKTIALNCNSFDQWIAELQPDIVLFDRFMMEEQFGWRVAEQCPNALRVLETVDLHCLRQTREQLLKKSAGQQPELVPYHSFAELYAAMATQDVCQRELASIYRCDISLMVSDVEIQLLTEYFAVPEFLLHHCPFLLDTPDSNAWPGFEQRHAFVSIGNFLHAPNFDSAQWIKKYVWPLIRARLPQAEMFVYGAYAQQKTLELNDAKQGFHIAGRAEDAFEVIRKARVLLAPLRFGAGIKGKLADAMLCGTPCVTTSIGAEAMGLSGYAYDNAESIANAAVELYSNRSSWQQAQMHGQTVLQQRFDKQTLGSKLIRCLQDCHTNLQQHRLNNFTGAMLQHHAHKSTHYMSRWIEAKNRLEAEKSGKL